MSCTTSSTPETVIVNGQEGIKIYPVAMLGAQEPTPENIAEQAERIRTGDHGGGLKKVASRYCPAGYSVLQKGEPVANVYVVTPLVQYRVTQEHIIACKKG